MDLAEIARVVRRRWYVMLPGMLLTVVAVVGLLFVVPTKYQSSSTVMLLNSQRATLLAPFYGNPFLSTQTTITGTVDVLSRTLMSDDSLAVLKSKGLTGTVGAKIADNAQAPLMDLTVTGTDKASVLASEKILNAYAKERLQELQAIQNTKPDAMILMTDVVPPTQPAAQTKSKLEYAVLLGLMGIAGSLVLVFWTEARHRPRPAGAGADGADSVETVGGPGVRGSTVPDRNGAGRSDQGAARSPAVKSGARAGAGAAPGTGEEAGAGAASQSDGESLENPTVQLSVLSLDETNATWRG